MIRTRAKSPLRVNGADYYTKVIYYVSATPLAGRPPPTHSNFRADYRHPGRASPHSKKQAPSPVTRDNTSPTLRNILRRIHHE